MKKNLDKLKSALEFISNQNFKSQMDVMKQFETQEVESIVDVNVDDVLTEKIQQS